MGVCVYLVRPQLLKIVTGVPVNMHCSQGLLFGTAPPPPPMVVLLLVVGTLSSWTGSRPNPACITRLSSMQRGASSGRTFSIFFRILRTAVALAFAYKRTFLAERTASSRESPVQAASCTALRGHRQPSTTLPMQLSARAMMRAVDAWNAERAARHDAHAAVAISRRTRRPALASRR